MTFGFSHTINGAPTYFREMILACERPQVVYYEVEGFKLQRAARTKLHTMRTSFRFKPGMKLHMVYGNRTKQRRQFALMTCVSTQTVLIRYRRGYAIERHEGIANLQYTLMVKNQYLQVFIDDKLIGGKTLRELAINDGFRSTTDFLKYFRKSGKYQLIHWTALKY